MISRTLEQILTDYKRSFSKQNKSVFIQKIYYLKNIWSADIIKPNVDWRYSFYILYRTQNTSSMSILTQQRKCFFNTNYQLFNFSWIFSVDQIKAVFDIPNLQWSWLSFADSGKRFEATEFVKIHWVVMW